MAEGWLWLGLFMFVGDDGAVDDLGVGGYDVLAIGYVVGLTGRMLPYVVDAVVARLGHHHAQQALKTRHVGVVVAVKELLRLFYLAEVDEGIVVHRRDKGFVGSCVSSY